MGRPLRKDAFGTDVVGTYNGNSGIRVTFYDASSRTDGVIIKQRGRRTFVVAQIGNIGTTSAYMTGTTTADAPNAYGEIAIKGYLDGGVDATEVFIRSLSKRIAIDFAGARYTWKLENFQDSTGDQLTLYPL
jgi:hypothetical protein